jgi:hypothetical protein
MAHLPYAFDARTVAPAAELGALPAGEYLVAITDSEFEDTKARDGKFLKLVFSVLDGPHKGAKIFDRLNLINKNQTAVDIAQRALSAICHAVGVLGVQDSQQLHDRPLKIKVNYEPAKGEYGENNRVKAYKPAKETLSPPVVPALGTAAGTPQPNAYEEAKGRAKGTPPTAIPPAGKATPWRKAPMHLADASTKKEAVEDDSPY